jgi:hypothetical protein
MMNVKWEGTMPRKNGTPEGLKRKTKGLEEFTSPCDKKVMFLATEETLMAYASEGNGKES